MNINSSNERMRIATLKLGDCFAVNLDGISRVAIKIQTNETAHFISAVDLENGSLFYLNRDTYVTNLPKAVLSVN